MAVLIIFLILAFAINIISVAVDIKVAMINKRQAFERAMIEARKIKHGCMPYDFESIDDVPCYPKFTNEPTDYKTREIL